MKDIIYGLMRNYHRQNTKYEDYKSMATKLFNHHVNRGWDRSTMKDWIISAEAKIQQEQIQQTTSAPTESEEPASNKEQVFLHFKYHKNNIPKSRVRTIYVKNGKELLSTRMGIKQLTIAYSRPKNIKDTITKAKLHQATSHEASKYYSGEQISS